MTTAVEITTLDHQISELELEIATWQKDIENLRQAFVALESNQLRPANPAADNAFELLKKLVGAAPQKLEQQQVYQAKLAAARESLKLAVEASQEKQRQLDALRQERREEQQAEAFDQLKSRAEEFNCLIDQAMAELDEMRSLAQQAGVRTLEVAADLKEVPYASINQSLIRVRRRFDVLQG